MNNPRRKQIDKIKTSLEEIQSLLIECTADLGSIRDDEEESMNNLPENLQESERYQKMEEAYENLDYAHSELENLEETLTEIIGYLEEAKA